MPRINQERTDQRTERDNEDTTVHKNAQYIEEHFPGASVNDGWAVDEVDRTYSSKVYGHGVVTTSMDPPFTTTFEPFTSGVGWPD